MGEWGGYFSVKSQLGLFGRKIVLAVSALWEERKGLIDIVKIATIINHVQQTEHSNSYQIVVIGVDTKQKRMLPNSIITINRTNDTEELRQWYGVTDVFINPTYEDNYPTTNLEAISCGTPVMAYDTGGSRESTIINGWIISKGNEVALAEQIIKTVPPDELPYYNPNLHTGSFISISLELFIDKMMYLYVNSCD